jgi:curved DNA-binding protein CbpA
MDQFNNSILDLEFVLKLNPKDSFVKNKIQELNRFLDVKTHYSVLNLSEDSSFEDIEKAYKRGLAKNHPDRFFEESEKNEATKLFQLIGEAYNVLSDSEMRKEYDFSLQNKKLTWEKIDEDFISNSNTTEMEYKFEDSEFVEDFKKENKEETKLPKIDPNVTLDEESEKRDQFKL